MVRPLRRAFFYTRPVLLTPPDNGLFVAFAGSTFGFLGTPTHAVQHMPHPGRIVADAETSFDHFRDPFQCPPVGPIPVGQRALQQQLPQFPPLPNCQLGPGTRMRLALQAFLPGLLVDFLPLRDSPRRDTKSPGYLAGSMTGFEQSGRLEP